MAIFKKGEFAEFCGVSPAHVSVAIKRGKVVPGNDGKIDSDHTINRLYRQHCDESKANKPAPPKVADTAEKPPKTEKSKRKAPSRVNTRLERQITEKFEIEKEERQARIQKQNLDAKILEMKLGKLSGKMIPTDLVANTIRQLAQSIMVSFNNGADALAVDISKLAGLNRNQHADIRKKLRQIVNEAVNTAVSDAQHNVANIVQEHTQNRAA